MFTSLERSENNYKSKSSESSLIAASNSWEFSESDSLIDSDNWLLTYVDVLTLILTLVVLLLAYQQIKKNEFGPQPKAKSDLQRPVNTDRIPEKSTPTRSETDVALKRSSTPKAISTWPQPNIPSDIGALSKPESATATSVLNMTDILDSVRHDYLPADTLRKTVSSALIDSVSSSIELVDLDSAMRDLASDNVDIIPNLLIRQAGKETPQDTESLGHHDFLQETLTRYKTVIASQGMNGFIEISEMSDAIRLEVNESILFATGSTQLKSLGMTLLQELAVIFNQQPGTVHVEGHTDNIPIATTQFPSNWELSSSRASTVTRYLIQQGIDPFRLRAIGLADTQPRASNQTPTGRTKNRRVSLVVTLGDPATE